MPEGVPKWRTFPLYLGKSELTTFAELLTGVALDMTIADVAI